MAQIIMSLTFWMSLSLVSRLLLERKHLKWKLHLQQTRMPESGSKF